MVFSLSTGVLAACSSKNAAGMPEDFSVTYDWVEGSVPPPYHYEYTIKLGPGTNGEMSLTPDYPGDGVPMWSESFTVEGKTLPALYDLMQKKGVFDREWKTMEDPPVGGSTRSMAVTSAGKTYQIPALAEEEGALQEIYDAIEATVPENSRANLLAKYLTYQQDNLEENN